MVDWLVGLMIYVALAIFQPYSDLEAGDNQSLKLSGVPLALQAKSLTTTPPLLHGKPKMRKHNQQAMQRAIQHQKCKQVMKNVT